MLARGFCRRGFWVGLCSATSEAPKDCKEIGEVSVGSFLPHVTMESVKNEMRNKTSAMGGNFLVIDEIKSVSSSTPPWSEPMAS